MLLLRRRTQKIKMPSRHLLCCKAVISFTHIVSHYDELNQLSPEKLEAYRSSRLILVSKASLFHLCLNLKIAKLNYLQLLLKTFALIQSIFKFKTIRQTNALQLDKKLSSLFITSSCLQRNLQRNTCIWFLEIVTEGFLEDVKNADLSPYHEK